MDDVNKNADTLFLAKGWNKRGGWNIFMKSINMECGYFFVERRVEFFKIGKRGLHIY